MTPQQENAVRWLAHAVRGPRPFTARGQMEQMRSCIRAGVSIEMLLLDDRFKGTESLITRLYEGTVSNFGTAAQQLAFDIWLAQQEKEQ